MKMDVRVFIGITIEPAAECTTDTAIEPAAERTTDTAIELATERTTDIKKYLENLIPN